MASPDDGTLEVDTEPEDFFPPGVDFSRFKVKAIRNFLLTDIDRGMVASLGENIDENDQCEGVVENLVLGIDIGPS